MSLTLAEIHVHPVKSCAGVSLRHSLLTETGLQYDREWMVVDSRGEFLSQREQPRMALVRTELRHSELVLRAPGMIALHLRLDGAEGTAHVQVWDDELPAFDMGDLAAQWFSDFLGIKGLRLAAFDSDSRRPSDPRWTAGVSALNTFSDGFPLTVVSRASLDELNRRLAQADQPAVEMNRLRANLVIDGVGDPHGEDLLETLSIATAEGPVVLKLTKPCARCSIPDVDPATGIPDGRLTPILQQYRSLPRMGGAVCFSMNAVIAEGQGRTLRVGDAVSASAWA